MLNRLSQTKNLELMQAHVNGLLYDQNTVYGVKTEDGRHIEGKTVILTTGTFLEGRIYISSWSKQQVDGRISCHRHFGGS